jgi:type IV pilus assembly protein PilX
MIANASPRSKQRGVALVTSLLLLLIITILALSMFRSFGTQEKIAGNLREKERALHAADSAQQYAEWWLLQGNNTAIGSVACTGQVPATPTSGQICNQTPQQVFLATPQSVTQVPWTTAGGNIIQVTYTPPGMQLLGQPALPGNPAPYFATPAFWITDRGIAADAAGEAYQIDAYGYGSAASTVAVVESVYEVQQGVVNRGGL